MDFFYYGVIGEEKYGLLVEEMLGSYLIFRRPQNGIQGSVDLESGMPDT